MFCKATEEEEKRPMTKSPPMTVKRLPEPCNQASRRSFLREVKEFVDSSHRPHFIVDLTGVAQISPESIDLLMECVGHVARGDGEVSVAGASPETSVVLEVTQAASVLNMFSSVLEAANDRPLHDSESWKQTYPQYRAA
jgi:anti-anti-sigma regulatory factor